MLGVMKNRHLRTFSSTNCSLGEVYMISIHQLKHLVINFRLNFPSSTYTLLWHTALTYLGNAILTLPTEETSGYYFLLCIYGYERLGQSWRVTQAIATALLSMALRSGDLTSEAAITILKSIQDRTFPIPGMINASFMADLNLAQYDPEFASVNSQAQNFEDNVYLRNLMGLLQEDTVIEWS